MKKIIYLLTLILFVGLGSVQSQVSVYTVSGTVTTMGTGLAVPNHPVTIAPLDSTIGFSVVAMTGTNGVYMASITLPPGMFQTAIVVSTYGNCGPNDFYSTIVFTSPTGPATADFVICDSITSTYCSAEFISNTNMPGVSPFVVMFSDLSIGNVINWTWSFGDGTTSSDQNPVHTYSVFGTYTVCLEIFTSDSCTSSFCETILVSDSIIFPPGCDAFFIYGTTPATGLPMFYDNSWATTPIVSWYWTFGDGNTSYDQNPVHSYNAIGWYNVCLTILTTDSCTSTYCEDIYYNGGSSTMCSAGYTYVNPGSSGNLLEVDFTDASTGSVIEWTWDFGDGSSSTAQNPSHIYSSAGMYQVCLDIYTSDSCSSMWCDVVFVNDSIINPPGCDAYFSYFGGFIGDLAFYDESYSATSIVSWNWTFGDGTASNIQNPIHTYNATGWYIVCLTIMTTDSCTSTYCENVYYGGTPTSCSAGYYYSYGPSGSIYEIVFADMSMGSVISWNWDFGDGSTSTDQNPTHIYSSIGVYQVCLDIFTADSCSSVWCDYVIVDTIINPQNCDAYFYYGGSGTVTSAGFYDMSYASTPIISWYWDFGDGTSSTDQNPNHNYNAVGIYTVCLTIMAADSCTSTYCEDIYYTGTNPGNCLSEFIATQNPVSNPLEVSFIDNSIGNVITWLWTFGDNTTSTDQNPVHLYSAPGVYEVCLLIFTSDSCTSSSCQFISVQTTTQTYNVSGAVWAGNDPVTNGMAMLMGINGSILVSDIDSGGYWFSNVEAGTYIVYAIPSFVNYPNYAPTYHDSALFWTDAIELTVSTADLTSIDVFLVDFTTVLTGPGSLSGSIIWPGTKSAGTYKDRMDMSLEDISLLLFDMDENLLEFTATDVTGYFEFDNLPYGTYKLFVELTGHNLFPAIITLDEGNSTVNDIIINIVDGSIVYDVEEIEAGLNNMKLYPNPVNDILFVEFLMESNSNVNCTVLNAFGQEVISLNESLTNGSQQIKIDVSDLAAGIYFVNLKQDNTFSKVMKFIK